MQEEKIWGILKNYFNVIFFNFPKNFGKQLFKLKTLQLVWQIISTNIKKVEVHSKNIYFFSEKYLILAFSTVFVGEKVSIL